MLEHNGFSAWISIEGFVATEYANEHLVDANKVSCWVASEAGKNFAVHWKVPSFSGLDPIAGQLFIDGISVEMHWLVKPSEATTKTISTTGDFSSIPVSRTEQRKFSFSTLILTDDDSYKDTTWFSWSNFTRNLEANKVHETLQKAGTHCVALGETVKIPSWRSRDVTLLRNLATFSFKYRPLDVLQANEIAPRPLRQASNPATPSSPAADGESSDEVHQLREQLHQIQARLDAIASKSRKRHASLDVEDKQAIKRVKKENIPVFLPGEIIDLTLD